VAGVVGLKARKAHLVHDHAASSGGSREVGGPRILKGIQDLLRRIRVQRPREPDPDSQTEQAVSELPDRYHPWASISDGDQMLMEPSKVLSNIAFAMECVDTDIDTPISIEEEWLRSSQRYLVALLPHSHYPSLTSSALVAANLRACSCIFAY